MSQYTNIKNTAARLIAKFGMAAIIRRVNDNDYPVIVVMAEYLPREKDGQLIQWTDRKAILAAQGLTIVPNAQTDQLIVDQDLQIVTVTKTSPGGDDIIYELQVRR
jgi:hypothetical protein